MVTAVMDVAQVATCLKPSLLTRVCEMTDAIAKAIVSSSTWVVSMLTSISGREARLPVSVDIRVTGVCNLACPFCFGPRHTVRANRLDNIIGLVPKLHRLGVRTIVVTGGEPLMVNRLPELLRCSKELNIQTVMSTNGTLVHRRHADVLPLLDWIALPIDGCDETTHELARPGKVPSFWPTIKAMNFIRETYPDLRIKVGTVITRHNADSVSQIPQAIARLAPNPDVWKIYQVSYSNYGADNRALLHISDVEFESVVKRAVADAAKVRWQVVVYRNSERDGKYLFIEPTGDAKVIVNRDEFVIGNFLSDFDGTVEKVSRYVDEERAAENVRLTYFQDDLP
jgi:MoaA/NifB/PqqE/SkfB family radical SAM enzyme